MKPTVKNPGAFANAAKFTPSKYRTAATISGDACSPVAINFGQPAIRPTSPPVWSQPAGTPATKYVTRASSPAAAIACAPPWLDP